MNNSDQNIIHGIRQGDKEVFKTIFKIYYQRIKLYAISYVGDPDAAEDIVQDLFFHLWEKRHELEIVTSFSAYLYKAIHNRCIQYLRHKKVVARYENLHLLKIKEAEILNQCESDFTFKEIEEIKERIFNNLTPKTKNIFQLSRIDHKNNKEIANVLDINIKTVEYHISKALKSFQLALRDYILLILTFLLLHK
jgi:RNA polymerase sigma-70 factor, ECF subfamily